MREGVGSKEVIRHGILPKMKLLAVVLAFAVMAMAAVPEQEMLKRDPYPTLNSKIAKPPSPTVNTTTCYANGVCYADSYCNLGLTVSGGGCKVSSTGPNGPFLVESQPYAGVYGWSCRCVDQFLFFAVRRSDVRAL